MVPSKHVENETRATTRIQEDRDPTPEKPPTRIHPVPGRGRPLLLPSHKHTPPQTVTGRERERGARTGSSSRTVHWTEGDRNRLHLGTRIPWTMRKGNHRSGKIRIRVGSRVEEESGGGSREMDGRRRDECRRTHPQSGRERTRPHCAPIKREITQSKANVGNPRRVRWRTSDSSRHISCRLRRKRSSIRQASHMRARWQVWLLRSLLFLHIGVVSIPRNAGDFHGVEPCG